MQEIVDETFKITMKPIYDTSLIKNKTKENLLQGEHVDYIWINEVWGGVKIGPNTHLQDGVLRWDLMLILYILGIDRVVPGRIPFSI